MWGEERKRKKEGPFFHIYVVTLIVKAPRDWLQWIYAWVCDFWHANTHKSRSVPKRPVRPGILLWKCHISRYHSDSIHNHKQSDPTGVFSVSVCLWNIVARSTHKYYHLSAVYTPFVESFGVKSDDQMFLFTFCSNPMHMLFEKK